MQNSDPLTAQLSPRVPRQREGSVIISCVVVYKVSGMSFVIAILLYCRSEPFKTPTKRKLLFTTGTTSSPRKR